MGASKIAKKGKDQPAASAPATTNVVPVINPFAVPQAAKAAPAPSTVAAPTATPFGADPAKKGKKEKNADSAVVPSLPLHFGEGAKVDPNALFAPLATSSAPDGKRKRGREGDESNGTPRPGVKNAEVKSFRKELKDAKKERKKHLSHLHDKPDPNELARTVFVGNLPNDISNKDFRKMFVHCGDIENVRIRSRMLDHTVDTKGKDRGRGVRILRGEYAKDTSASATGFVLFKNPNSIEEALRMTGTVHEGHHIYVSREDDQSKAFDPRNSIYLGNLAYDVSDEEIWQFFIDQGFNDVMKVRVVRDRDSAMGKGFAYVSFRNPNSVNKSIATCRQGLIHGREVRICHVQRSKDAKVKTVSRRELRRQAERTAPKAGPAAPAAKKGDAQPKTSTKRQAAKDADANPEWMGMTTNPRKKLARDLRPLIPLTPAERKALAKKAPRPIAKKTAKPPAPSS